MEPSVDAYGIFLDLFKGREDYFAQQYESWYRPVPCPFDAFYLNQHLAGDATYGVYVLTSGSFCHFFCVDIDIPKTELAGTAFADRTAKYAYLGQRLRDTIQALTETLAIPREALLLEDTGGRGYHIWIFLRNAMPGGIAVAFGAILKKCLQFEIEFFPKQGQLTPGRKLGNLVKLPLGLHRTYGARSVFFTVPDGQPQYVEGLDRGLECLTQVVSADTMPVLATVRDHPGTVVPTAGVEMGSTERDMRRPLFKGDLSVLAARCAAIQGLRTKAEGGQRLTRAEAFHFANILLSAEHGQEYIVETMQASYGTDYDERRTLGEISRIRPLFPTSCATLVEQGICSGYCRNGVRKRNTDPLLTNTTPCGVWLTRLHGVTPPDPGDLVARIGEASNVRRSFFQLKAYHEHEDSLFFDPFDFEQFEQDLPSNCETIAAILRERSTAPFAGPLAVEIPKKLEPVSDTEYRLLHRKMAYSTVHDQVPIQAVFNVVAPLVENACHDYSYGYRWNLDEHKPHRIFDDWREAYPRFRGHILAALRGNPNGFHISCDIKGYYDHVDHAILAEQLRGIIRDSYVLQFVIDVVAMYRHDDSEAKGLPQGPAYARLLANLYLNDFDTFVAQHTANYLRYVDDLFLFFDSEQDAALGLQEVVDYLRGLGLELSEADDKRPIVTPNTDESRVRQSLDRIQYGILEGTRQLKHLKHSVVSDFSDAVERHSVSPTTLATLLDLNEYMPSLLYVVTEESLIRHPLRSKVWAIVRYLIEHHWFCPKRLKMVFYRLLDLSPTEEDLALLYDSMEPAHKVYFILSIYAVNRSSGKHRELLERLTGMAVQDGYGFLRGFGIAIGCRIGLKDTLSLASVSRIQELSRDSSYFAPAKWASEIAYLSLGDDERAAARHLVSPDSKSLLKALVLGNLGGEPRTYLDGKYLCNILDGADGTFLPAVCSLIVSSTGKSDLFDKLLEVACSRPTLKPAVVAMLSAKLFDSEAGAGRARIENLRALYEHVADQEIKRVLLACLERISGDSLPDANGIAFAKGHLQLARYNECYLFGYTGQSAEYDCLEVIPLSRSRQYVPLDAGTLKGAIEDLSAHGVLSPLKFVYDAGSQEMHLQLRLVDGLRPVSKEDFHLDSASILRALRVATHVFKKACYFHRVVGKAPFIHVDNLLVSASGTTIVFRTVGMSLRSPYTIDGAAIGDDEEDIPRMVAMLLARLLIGDSRALQEFLKAAHTGIESFLALFIRNMSSKAPAEVYSCRRFEYMVDELIAASERGHQQVAALYMRERLKGCLFRRNSHRVSWYGVSGAVGEHVSHLREICSRDSLNRFAYRDRVALSLGPRRQLHWVGQQLLNLTMNRGIGPTGGDLDPAYAALVEHLLLFSAVAIEVLALYRGVRKESGRTGLPLAVSQTCRVIRVSSSEYERAYEASELASAMMACPTERAYDATHEAGELSLSQMMLHVLLAFGVRIAGDGVLVCDGGAMPTSVFRPLAHACLIRVPRIEDDLRVQVAAVLEALRSNDEIVLPGVGASLREDLIILAHDFGRVRKHLRIRRCFGAASGQGYFPPDVMCRSLLGRTTVAKEAALLGSPLTSKLPASKYRCSWDLQAGSVVNLVVPDDGLNSLLSELKAGKFFGVKMTYLYSGRMMLVYDMLMLVMVFGLLVLCEYGGAVLKDHAVWKALLGSGSVIFKAIVLAILGKLIVWDIGHWIRWWPSWIGACRKANDRETNS
jgi:retron-type reverse transcriptase